MTPPQLPTVKDGDATSAFPCPPAEPPAPPGPGDLSEYAVNSDARFRAGLSIPGLQLLNHLGSRPLGDLYEARAADGRTRLPRVLPDLTGAGGPEAPVLARLSSLRHAALPPL